MILRRLGNKTKIADKIIQHFPPHQMFIDMFFGAGGIFFNKPLAQHNILNDIDDDVFNLYQVVINRTEELIEAIELMPITESLLKYWNTYKETDPIRKALRFLMLSNFGFFGQPDTLRFEPSNPKRIILSNVQATLKKLKFALLMCTDFRNVLEKIHFPNAKDNAFVYADPPYLNQTHNYKAKFAEKDTIDLFQLLVNSGIRFAVSEFDNDLVLKLAKDYNLNVIIIGERQNLLNRRTEILITNYKTQPSLFDDINSF
jgi:DNA adenine methylase